MVDLFIEGQVLTEMDKGEESLEKEGWDILTKVLEWVISKFEITDIRFQSYWKNFLNEESLRYSRPGYCILKEFWNQSGKKKLEKDNVCNEHPTGRDIPMIGIESPDAKIYLQTPVGFGDT